MFDEAVLEVPLNSTRQRFRLLGGLAVALALVVGLSVAAAVTDSTVKRIIAVVAAVILLVLAIVVGAGGWLATRPHRLAFAPDGFGLIGPSGLVWRVLWPEAQRVTVVERPWRRGLARQWTVVLVVRPATADFGPSHPELARYRSRFGAAAGDYGILIGPGRELIDPIAQALHATAGAADGGVVRAETRPDAR